MGNKSSHKTGVNTTTQVTQQVNTQPPQHHAFKSRGEKIKLLLSFGYLRQQEREYIDLYIPQSIKQIIVMYTQFHNCKIFGIGTDILLFGTHHNDTYWNRLHDLETIAKDVDIHNFYKNYKSLIVIEKDYNIKIYRDNKTSLIPSTMKIISASTGCYNKYHTFVVDEYHTIYASGCNAFGKDAFGYHKNYVIKAEDDFQVLIQIPSFIGDSNDTVIDIKCGVQHSLFLTQYQHLYALGQNAYGQLCTDKYKSLQVCTFVLDGISSIDVGQNHNVLINNEDELLIYGNFDCSPYLEHQSLIKYFKDNNITFMIAKCGISHCVCVSKKGRVFAFGQNDFGQMGYQEKRDKIVKPVVIDLDSAVMKADCGAHHNILLDNNNNLYCWGSNHYKQCSAMSTLRVIPHPYYVDKEKELKVSVSTYIWSIFAFHNNSIVFVD